MKRYIPFAVIISFLCIVPQNSYANPLKNAFEKATFAFRSGDPKKAVALYEKTLEIQPNFAPTFYQLALCHQALGTESSEIIWLFNRTVEIDPKHFQAHEHLGKMYYSEGDFDKAEYHTKRALELRPDLLSAKLALAWIYLLGKGEPEKAIPNFRDILTKTHEIPYAYFGLGMAYAQSDQMPLVLEMITELRNSNHEYLAVQLEQMMRENRYIEPVNLSLRKSLGMQQGAKNASVSQTPQISTISYSKEEREQSVRLRGNSKFDESPVDNQQPPLSGDERIRQLQQRQANQPGY